MICKDCGEKKSIKSFQKVKNKSKISDEVFITSRKTCNTCNNNKWTKVWVENNKERFKEVMKDQNKRYELELRDCKVRQHIKRTKQFKDSKFNITDKCIEMKKQQIQSRRDYNKYVNRYLV